MTAVEGETNHIDIAFREGNTSERFIISLDHQPGFSKVPEVFEEKEKMGVKKNVLVRALPPNTVRLRGKGDPDEVYEVWNLVTGQKTLLGGKTGRAVCCIQDCSADTLKRTSQLKAETGDLKVAYALDRAELHLQDIGIKLGREYPEIARLARSRVEQGYYLEIDEKALMKSEGEVFESWEDAVRFREMAELRKESAVRHLTKNYLPKTVEAYCQSYALGEDLTLKELCQRTGRPWNVRHAGDDTRNADEVFRRFGWRIGRVYEQEDRLFSRISQRYHLERVTDANPYPLPVCQLGAERGCLTAASGRLLLSLIENRSNVPVFQGSKLLFTFGLTEGLTLCPRMQDIKNADRTNFNRKTLEEARGVAVFRLEYLMKKLSGDEPDDCLVAQLGRQYRLYGENYIRALTAPLSCSAVTERVGDNGVAIGKMTKEVRIGFTPHDDLRPHLNGRSRPGVIETEKTKSDMRLRPSGASTQEKDTVWLKEAIETLKKEEEVARKDREEVNAACGLYYDPRWLTLPGVKRAIYERTLVSL